ncbi:molybdenum cofactor guanylyltransferase [Dokdonia sp.]|uniref:molybdenum cofactor guanylyltransferase n=1 Tax=Dokdonia sp. TaxID=2024995 RepID=UPI0032653FC1
MTHKANITGIILSGGKSSRMGTDKGFVTWRDKLFVQHSIDALKPIVHEIIIVSDYPKYDTLGYKRVEDSIPEAGPLSGLYSGLKESNTELNLVLSCDVPLITSDILEELIARYRKGTTAVVCEVSTNIMPLVALYNKNCYKVCESLLQSGERRMMRLIEKLDNTSYLVLNDKQSECVKNINSLDDLKELNNAN